MVKVFNSAFIFGIGQFSLINRSYEKTGIITGKVLKLDLRNSILIKCINPIFNLTDFVYPLVIKITTEDNLVFRLSEVVLNINKILSLNL